MSIAANLSEIKQRILQAEQQYQRPLHSVKLIAVTKQQSIDAVKQAIAAGQTDFGENYCQQAVPKILACGDDIAWHFIGRIQRNKTKVIAENFAWVHSIDRFEVAERFSTQRPQLMPPLNVCVEVNISEQTSKAGIAPHDCLKLIERIIDLPNIKFRGLMAIPTPETEFSKQCAVYGKMMEVFRHVQAAGIMIDTLSMGMSQDYIAAIKAGSTMVRIGTAIFGERQ